MQTRKIKGGITPKSKSEITPKSKKSSRSTKSKKKLSNKSAKFPSPPYSIFDKLFKSRTELFESRTELKQKFPNLIEHFEDLNEPYNSLEPKIEKIKNVSFDILNGSYGEINQPNNKKYIPEVIEGIQKRYANIKNQIKNDVDNKFIEIKQEVEYITTYINKKYGDKTIFEKKTVVEGIIKNIHEINEKIDMLHNKIADFHNYIDNLKTEIDNLNTDIQFAKKEVIEKETHAKQIEKEEIQRKKEENDAKKIKLKSTGKKSQLVNKLDMKEKSKEKSPEIIKEKSKGKSQEKSQEKNQEKNQEKIRENSKERSPEKSKEKSPEKIHDISPNFHLYNTNFITDPGEDVVQLNDTLNDISNKIFDVIGLFTKKYPHRIILHLCTFKTPIIDAKKQKVIADFTPRYAYLPIREYHNRS